MKTSLLLFSPLGGIIGLLVMLIASFVGVHIFLLAKTGWEIKKTKKDKPAPPTEKPQKPPEPVYYLVEKRKKRPKNSYSPPREIHFK